MKALHFAFLRSHIHFLFAIFSTRGASSRRLRSFNAYALSLLLLILPIAPLGAAPSRVSPKDASLVTTSFTRTTGRIGTTQPPSHSDDQPLVPDAVSVTASLADDIGLGVKKNQGDTITYTAVISAGGMSPGDDATGVVFTDILNTQKWSRHSSFPVNTATASQSKGGAGLGPSYFNLRKMKGARLMPTRFESVLF
jgi:hypothetical protein